MIESILHVASLAWLVWCAVAIAVGGSLLCFDEWRFRRSTPRREDVLAYADRLVLRHGQDAFAQHGDAMRGTHSKDFDRRRFLNEVSKELVDRLVRTGASSGSCETVRKTG